MLPAVVKRTSCVMLRTRESQIQSLSSRNIVHYVRPLIFPPSLSVQNMEGEDLEGYIMWYCSISNIIKRPIQLQRSYRNRQTSDKRQALILALETNHNRMAVVQEAGLGTYFMTSYHGMMWYNFPRRLSLVPRPSTPLVFDCLQYAKAEGEGLGNLITWSEHGWHHGL